MSKDHLKRQLTKYRDALANLSRRNRELFYREQVGSTVNLSKSPFGKTAYAAKSEPGFKSLKSVSVEFGKLIEGAGLNLNNHFELDKIADPKAVTALQRRLDKTRLADDRHQREFGISGAWLLGPFLIWRMSAASHPTDLLISPILKIPVDLEKKGASKFNLIVEEDELSLNPSLSLALKIYTGLKIEEGKTFDSAESAVSFLKAELEKLEKQVAIVDRDSIPKLIPRSKAVYDEDGEIIGRKETVLTEELNEADLKLYEEVTHNSFAVVDVVYLDQLNASRAVLLHDYENLIEVGLDHPILNELFTGAPTSEEPPIDRSKLRELDDYHENTNHFVVNIDSTQHRAIESARKSSAVVIQGPPGTGKSQTITNLIADYLVQGKRVLFVSEKRAALDVVYNRLRQADISTQAVLLHSSDLNKTDLYESFLQLSEATIKDADERNWSRITSDLQNVKKDLNQYADVLQLPHERTNESIADLLVLASRTQQNLFNPELKKLFSAISSVQLEALVQGLDEIQSIYREIKDLKSSSWLARKNEVVKSATLIYELNDLLGKLVSIRQSITNFISEAEELLGQSLTPNLEKVISAFRLNSSAFLKRSQEIPSIWPLSNELFPSICEQKVNSINQAVAELKKRHAGYMSIQPEATAGELSLLEHYYQSPRGFADWFTAAFWENRKNRNRVCRNWDGTNLQFVNYREYIDSYRQLITSLNSLTADSFENPQRDLLAIENRALETISALTDVRKHLQDAKSNLPEKLYDQVASSPADLELTAHQCDRLMELVLKISNARQEFVAHQTSLDRFVTGIGTDPNNLEKGISVVQSMIDQIEHLNVLDRADIAICQTVEKADFKNLKVIIHTHLLDLSASWSACLQSTVLNGWVEDTMAKHVPLRSFTTELANQRLSNFRLLETQHRESARGAVQNQFAKRWCGPSSDRSGIPLLRKEASKQRKVLSPREIMSKGALNTMLQLKPCWLMSPLSISQMLPFQMGLFDVIIFDEASQVRVEDALPSIYRAKTMVVVGDNKQMPPTNFFGGTQPDDDEDDEEIAASVLDLAASIYPSVLLEWHYRSRSETLIAFSNRAFYGGRLIAPPNPGTLASGDALRFVRVKGAYFTSRDANTVEAEAVVNELERLLIENPERSFGVIAMGVAQAAVIDEAVEQRKATSDSFRRLIEKAENFREKGSDSEAGLFIRNLENVQGDERDVILMSVGYAPAAPDKKLRMNFGPLGKVGGGRRLNVAITRAKSKMIVFASFDPAEIGTDEAAFAKNLNLAVFGRYLKYVEAISNGNDSSASAILNSFPVAGTLTSRKSSRFALDVKRRLEENGHKVSAEIGSSGFFVDLAIHHPVLDTTFMLGIECDGAIFHSTPYARDRDKIRQDLLESRGWKIIRVWSQDWSRDWAGEILKIEAKIKTLSEVKLGTREDTVDSA